MKKGDIIKLEYDAWFVDGEELFETTSEELAKEKEIFEEGRKYGPVTSIVGEGRLIPGLDKSLLEAEMGKEMTVEIPATDAYGDRDAKLVEVHSRAEIMRLPEFQKGDKEPYIGMQIQLKNKIGFITTVTAGRIRIDFNNRLAGKALKYKYKVVGTIDDKDKVVEALIDMHYIKPEEFKVTLKEGEVDIVLSDLCKYDSSWLAAKFRLVSDIRKYAGLDTIRFVEEYIKKRDEEDGEGEEKKEEVEVGEKVEVDEGKEE